MKISDDAIRELVLSESDRIAAFNLTSRDRRILEELYNAQDPLMPQEIIDRKVPITSVPATLTSLWKRGCVTRTSASIIGRRGYIYSLTGETKRVMETHGIPRKN